MSVGLFSLLSVPLHRPSVLPILVECQAPCLALSSCCEGPSGSYVGPGTEGEEAGDGAAGFTVGPEREAAAGAGEERAAHAAAAGAAAEAASRGDRAEATPGDGDEQATAPCQGWVLGWRGACVPARRPGRAYRHVTIEGWSRGLPEFVSSLENESYRKLRARMRIQ